MNQSTEHIQLGKIMGVFGVQGWVKIFSHTSPREQIGKYPHWLFKKDGDWFAVKVLQVKQQGKNLIAQLEGIDDRNQAEALIGSEIVIESNQLEHLPNGEYYWRELLGLSVKTLKGEDLGIVDWLFDTGSNDVMVINGESVGERERMIPFVMDSVIHSIDLENSQILVDWDYDF